MSKYSILLLFSFVFFEVGAKAPCDSELTPVSQADLEYQPRAEDRCEGFYHPPATTWGGRLLLVGLTRGGFASGKEAFALSAPGITETVQIRAVALSDQIHYRLDGSLAPGKSLNWPIAVLQAGGMNPEAVGVYGQLTERVYVPVRIDQADAPVTVILRSPKDITRLLWRHAPLADGRCGRMGESESLEPPARVARGEIISLVLPTSESLCLEATALRANGSGWVYGSWRVRQ